VNNSVSFIATENLLVKLKNGPHMRVAGEGQMDRAVMKEKYMGKVANSTVLHKLI
jgi:hypothetical protein